MIGVNALTCDQQGVLAHGLREQVMQLLRLQPLAAKQVATALGSTVGNTYYHLQRLVQADLIEVQEEVSARGVVERRYCAKIKHEDELVNDLPDLLDLEVTL